MINKNECVRESIEAREELFLSPHATLVKNSRGRETYIEKCPMRTDFMRDRDRIIHCKSFRRMTHKTQVFIAPTGDHFRTRLTHTLEVAQIARTIARALRLNEDLTEAIALGHDLGHTPFGHIGEAVLNSLIPNGFSHNEQSLRIVTKLENGTGLNLTYEVRDGILNHRTATTPSTMEGQTVRISDKIAYINHDIDDAIRAGLLTVDTLPKSSVALLGATHSDRIGTLIRDIVDNSVGDTIMFSPVVGREFKTLLNFMYESLYYSKVAKREEGRAELMMTAMYRYYLDHSMLLPSEFLSNVEADGLERVVGDYIACMTDRFAINEFEKLFVPREW